MKSIGQITITKVYDGEQGPQGPTGPTGATGRGIASVTEYYLATSSSSGITTGSPGWSTTVQSITSVNKYLWNYEKVKYTDNTEASTAPIIIGVYGDTGGKGDTGKGIKSITEYYLASNASSGVTTATAGWSTNMQALTPTNKYLWNYEKITYTDDSVVNIAPVIIGVYGDTGPTGPEGKQGIQGPTGPSGTSQYVHIRYSANSNGNPMTSVPQSDTAYIGLANTTSSTAPTLTTAYTWGLIKGPQGQQGIQGPTGPSGQTTYTWVKYADDEYGGNMTDTPSGKRYVGLAFNKTTPTETQNASDYQWSPLYDNVKPGGRNLIVDSDVPIDTTTDYLLRSLTLTEDLIGNEEYTFILKGELSHAGQKFGLWMNGGSTNVGYVTRIFRAGIYYITFKAAVPTAGNERKINLYNSPSNTTTNAEVEWMALYRGNVPMDWTPTPEDIRKQIDEKAKSSDLDSLATIVSSVSAELNAKAGMGEFQALQEAYNKRIEQEVKDKEKVASDLATLSGRMTLAETLLGNSKRVTEFIQTVITEAEEGIYIANKGSKTGILIASNRISFMDNDVEVAYISNKTMRINHGIFVESATISNFKFEKIPGTTILAIQWVDGIGG